VARQRRRPLPGVVALLNDARLAAGKPSLGFLNSLIYCNNRDGFNDILVGNAPGCGTPGFNVSALLV
jgi:tripeptidyl-peptidase-1